MKPAPRWPLHLFPKEGEALSSWLNRVAACYQMDMVDLLEHDLGHSLVDDLDIAPPPSLLTALSQRSGIDLDRLRCMSLTGWVPWLLDSLDDRLSAALETYAFQFSVLLPKRNRKTRSITRWRAWLPSQSIHRACPLCLNEEPRTGFANGIAAVERKQEPDNHWEEAIKAINEALAEARYNPETARSLFDMASWGRRDSESLQRLRDMFVKDGIPSEFLSHYVPKELFACLR